MRTLAEDLGHGTSNLHDTIIAIIEKCAFISGVTKYNVYGNVWKPLISENLLLNERLHYNSINKICPSNVMQGNDSEPLVSQVLPIYLYGENISVKLTSSDKIANNFAEEWRFFINNWSAVSQVKQKSIA